MRAFAAGVGIFATIGIVAEIYMIFGAYAKSTIKVSNPNDIKRKIKKPDNNDDRY